MPNLALWTLSLSDLPEPTITETEGLSPGVGGFFVIFCMAVVIILLGIQMTRKIRRVEYRAGAMHQREAIIEVPIEEDAQFRQQVQTQAPAGSEVAPENSASGDGAASDKAAGGNSSGDKTAGDAGAGSAD